MRRLRKVCSTDPASHGEPPSSTACSGVCSSQGVRAFKVEGLGLGLSSRI